MISAGPLAGGLGPSEAPTDEVSVREIAPFRLPGIYYLGMVDVAHIECMLGESNGGSYAIKLCGNIGFARVSSPSERVFVGSISNNSLQPTGTECAPTSLFFPLNTTPFGRSPTSDPDDESKGLFCNCVRSSGLIDGLVFHALITWPTLCSPSRFVL